MGYHYDGGGYSLHGQKVALEMPFRKAWSALGEDCRSRSVNGHLAGQILVRWSVSCQFLARVVGGVRGGFSHGPADGKARFF